MKRYIFALFIFFTINHPLSTINCSDGGRPGYFLREGIGVRPLGMGRAFVAAADDVSAVFWNPAGLSRLKNNELTAGYLSLFEETSYSFASYASPIGKKFSWGAGYAGLNSGGLTARDNLNNPIGEMDESDSFFMLSAGWLLHRRLGLGTGFKLVRKEFAGRETSGLLSSF